MFQSRPKLGGSLLGPARLLLEGIGGQKGRDRRRGDVRRGRQLSHLKRRARLAERNHLLEQDTDLLDRIAQLIPSPLEIAQRRSRAPIGSFGPALAELAATLTHALDRRVEMDEHALELRRAQRLLGCPGLG